jgi:hypothetical protein
VAQGTEIDRLFVKIEGDIAGLKASMSRATGEVEKAQKGMSSNLAQIVRSFSSVDGAALRVAGGAGLVAAALLKGSQSAVQYADNLADTAKALGVNVERLQEYRYAATQAGVSQEELERALMKLNLSIGDAVRNGGPAAEKFKALDIAVTDAGGNVRRTDEVFRDLADRLFKIPSEAERAAAAGDLVGDKLGTKMQELLARGSSGFDKLGEAARRAGAVMDEAAIQRAGEAQDKFDALAIVTKAQLTMALVDLAPALLVVAETIAKVASFARDAGIALKAMFGAGAYSDRANELNDEIEDLEQRIKKLQQRTKDGYLIATDPEGHRRRLEELRQLQGVLDLTKQKQLEVFASEAPGAKVPNVTGSPTNRPVDKKAEEEAKKAREAELERQAAFFEAYDAMQADNDEKALRAQTERRTALLAAAAETNADLLASELAKNDAIVRDENATTEERVAALMTRQALEAQLENDAFMARREELLALQTTSDEEEALRRAALEELDRLHQNNLTAIEKDGAVARKAVMDMEYAERLAAARTALGNLSSLMASESKKMFEVGKAAAMAETIVSTYSAAQKAYQAMAGIPVVGPALGAAAAAAAVLDGTTRLNAIKSTQFGSRSVGVSTGGGKVVNTSQAANAAAASGSGPTTYI